MVVTLDACHGARDKVVVLAIIIADFRSADPIIFVMGA